MIYYMIDFDPQPGVDRKRLTEAYRVFYEHIRDNFPVAKFKGLFAQDMLIGHGHQYFALWELPDYAGLDRWKEFYTTDEVAKELTKELHYLGINWQAKIVTRVPIE
ncbi:MAG: hypothetical protein ACE5HK_00685 [Candidatus Methylomirabilales bacterium]